MKRVLLIQTSPETKEMLYETSSPEIVIETVTLTESVDYAQLVRKIFEADSVQVW